MAINDWDFAVNLKSRRSSRRRDNLVRSLGSRHISTGKEEFPFEYRPPFRAQAVTNIWIATPSVLPRRKVSLAWSPSYRHQPQGVACQNLGKD